MKRRGRSEGDAVAAEAVERAIREPVASQTVFVGVPVHDERGAVIDLRMADPAGAGGGSATSAASVAVVGQLASAIFENPGQMARAADLAWREGASSSFETRRRSIDGVGVAVAECDVTVMRLGERIVMICNDRSEAELLTPSESVLGSVIDASDIGMILFRPTLVDDVVVGLHVVWHNDAARRLWGEAIREWADRDPQVDGEPMLVGVAREAWTSGTVNRLRHLPPTQERSALTISQTLQRVGNSLLEIAVDLTDEAEVHEAMRQLETRFGETLDTVTDRIFVLRPTTDVSGGLAMVEATYLNVEARRALDLLDGPPDADGAGPTDAVSDAVSDAPIDVTDRVVADDEVVARSIMRAASGERVEYLFGDTTEVRHPGLGRLAVGHVTFTPTVDGSVLVVVRDLTQLHEAHGRLERAIAVDEMVVDALSEAAMIFEFGPDGEPMVVACNDMALTWLPHPPPCSIRELPYGEASGDVEAGVRLAIEEAKPSRTTMTIVDDVVPDGDVIAYRLVHSPMAGNRSLMVFHDVSPEVNEGRMYRRQMREDPETGLPNAVGFLEELEELFGSDVRPSAVLAIRLDQFERIEHALGPAVVGEVIGGIVDRVRAAVPTGSLLGRLRFTTLGVAVVSGPDADPSSVDDLIRMDAIRMDQIRMVAEEVAEVVGQPVRVGGRAVHVDGHVGMVPVDAAVHGAADANLLMQRARSAATKALTLNHRLVVWDEQMALGDLRQLDLLAGVQRAIDDGEFDVEYQPVLTPTADLVGAEALVRWNHPVHGRLLPGSFIELVEASSLVLPFTRYVLHRAVSGYLESGLPGTCTINLPPGLLTEPALVPLVEEVLAETGFPAERLCLEATERGMMSVIEFSVPNLERLRQLGVAVSVDDFGTGSSSLMHLERFGFDAVKINRSVVEGIVESRVKQTILTGMVRIGEALGIDVVAEGVETLEEFEKCVELGVHALQGYSLERPGPLADWAARFLD